MNNRIYHQIRRAIARFRLPHTRSGLGRYIPRHLPAKILLAFFSFYLAVYVGIFGRIPSARALKERQHSAASEVYSADGVLLGRYFIDDRVEIPYEQVPATVINALVATEDARFFSHHGIDPRSCMRVFFKTLLLQNDRSGGGSTISQQLAKNLYPRKHYWLMETPINKIREMVIASRLEGVFSKQEILTLYLNTVHMGGNVYGIERGAQLFFNKPAAGLKTQEAAVLIAMLKASTWYNPRRNPERSKARRNVVLGQMARYGYLSASELQALRETPLGLRSGSGREEQGLLAAHFREMLRKELQEWCNEHEKSGGEAYNLYRDGLKIYTTIDAKMQAAAEEAVYRNMSGLQRKFDAHWSGRDPWGSDDDFLRTEIKRSHRYRVLKEAGVSDEEIRANFRKPVAITLHTYSGAVKRTMTPLDSIGFYQRQLNAGLVSVNPATAEVKAWVGGSNFRASHYDHVLAKRQAGSTFKPILYAAALEEGLEPCSVFENRRVSYNGWSPENADGVYGGQYTMVQALAHSVNTISAQVMDQVGPRKTIRMAEKLGIESDLPKVPSLALGTAEVSLLEMVRAYSTFANRGVNQKPFYLVKIASRKGEVLQEFEKPAPKEALDPMLAETMLAMMSAVINEGSGMKLRTQYGLRMDIAGKTGTTQNQSDGWFIGITPELVTGVWVGGQHPSVRFRTLQLGQGSATALPIWGSYMTEMAYRSPYRFANAAFQPMSAEVESRLACMLAPAVQEQDFLTLVKNEFDTFRESRKERRERRRMERDRKGLEREMRKQWEKLQRSQKKHRGKGW
jgi:penicillin-binding protein 1A